MYKLYFLSYTSIIANLFSNSFSVKKTIFSLVALVITLIIVEPTNAVNPLEMYVGAPEGVAIYRSKDGVEKVFPNVIYSDFNDNKVIWGMKGYILSGAN